MSSTHYMDLLMDNSPWNLIFFMAIPVILAESMAITELYLLWGTYERHPVIKKINRICGVLAGIVFIAIIAYFIPHIVVPITETNSWRTWIDLVAIVSYLASGMPMICIALFNLGIIAKNITAQTGHMYHIVFLAAFLILSHIAMIFGMVDPSIAGWTPDAAGSHQHMMHEHPNIYHDHQSMQHEDPHMNHPHTNHQHP